MSNEKIISDEESIQLERNLDGRLIYASGERLSLKRAGEGKGEDTIPYRTDENGRLFIDGYAASLAEIDGRFQLLQIDIDLDSFYYFVIRMRSKEVEVFTIDEAFFLKAALALGLTAEEALTPEMASEVTAIMEMLKEVTEVWGIEDIKAVGSILKRADIDEVDIDGADDTEKAKIWFMAQAVVAIEAERPDLINVSSTYSIGSVADAVDRLKTLATSGDTEAIIKLARIYAEGDGVRKSIRKSEKWYRKAIALGSSDAAMALATAYEKGSDGFRVNLGKAAELYYTAASLGSSNARKKYLELEPKYLPANQCIGLKRDSTQNYIEVYNICSEKLVFLVCTKSKTQAVVDLLLGSNPKDDGGLFTSSFDCKSYQPNGKGFVAQFLFSGPRSSGLVDLVAPGLYKVSADRLNPDHRPFPD